MDLLSAFSILDIENDNISIEILRNQFTWLAKFYHPDNPHTGNATEFMKTVAAYTVAMRYVFEQKQLRQ